MSDSIKVGAFVVQRTRIIGTKCDVFRAYEPAKITNTHGSITTIGGVWFGEVASRALPAELETLPRGVARWDAVKNFRDTNEAEAYAAIVEAFPEASSGSRSMGTIEVWS